jgi:hypothetical protein
VRHDFHPDHAPPAFRPAEATQLANARAWWPPTTPIYGTCSRCTRHTHAGGTSQRTTTRRRTGERRTTEHRGPTTGDMAGHIPFACFGLPGPAAGRHTHMDATLAVCPSNLLPHTRLCRSVPPADLLPRVGSAPHATNNLSPAARPLVRPGSHDSAFVVGAAGSPHPGLGWPPRRRRRHVLVDSSKQGA